MEEMLTRAMDTVESGETDAYIIPLHAIHGAISLSAELEPPGHFRVLLTVGGDVMAKDVYSRQQVLTIVLKLLERNERVITIQAALLQKQTEAFLKEQLA